MTREPTAISTKLKVGWFVFMDCQKPNHVTANWRGLMPLFHSGVKKSYCSYCFLHCAIQRKKFLWCCLKLRKKKPLFPWNQWNLFLGSQDSWICDCCLVGWFLHHFLRFVSLEICDREPNLPFAAWHSAIKLRNDMRIQLYVTI